ncbi:hypothetical protein ACFL27_03875 [candidate division CSSED10-310 bacterium]|uniref:Sodium:solute symporter family protein n=1 Tax=candidate division CSSED10-310 bacterium TaxID=2855610 RepID=A0ABV6YSY9_UNCC1
MNEAVFTPEQGWLLIAGYAGAVFSLAWLFSKRFRTTKEEFLVANRELGKWEAAFSIAATWIWAPALFIAAQKAYTQGLVGLFWFTVPNILCLVFFAYFAALIRRKAPAGFTLSAYIRARFTRRVQALYLLELIGLAACSFAVQLLAGGKVIAVLTGIPFYQVTIVLAGIALSYSVLLGLKASVVSDWAQMGFILLVGSILIPWCIQKAGGLNTLYSGLGGLDGGFRSLFNTQGLEVLYAFGIPVTIGLIAGPFGDQSFYQRAFAIREHYVKKAFIWGAVIFGIVPLLMSCLGFIAAGKSITVSDPALVNLEMVKMLLPAWALIPFVFMLMSGLISTLDSNLCAMSSLAGHDLLNTMNGDSADNTRIMSYSRFSMIILAIFALGIAQIPGVKILHLFLFYGVLRASTLLPTIMTLLSDKILEKGVFYGIIVSITIGLPIFAYGNFCQLTSWRVVGAILTVSASGIITFIASWISDKKG